jgi:RND family efflux transporter MFP subunit
MIKKLFKKVGSFFFYLKKKKYIILLLILFVWGGYYFFGPKQQESSINNVSTFEVATGSIISSIDTFGKSNLLYEQKLKFSQTGKVKRVLVKQWDEVKEGYILAELDNEEAQNDIKQAQVKVENARSSLDKLLYEKENFEYVKLRNDEEAQQSKLESLKKEIEVLIKEQALQRKEKEMNYFDTTKKLEESKKNLPTSKEDIIKEISLLKKDIETKKRSLTEKQNDLPDFISREEKSRQAKLSAYDLALKTKYLSLKSSLLTLTQDFDSINSTLVAERKNSESGKIRSQYFAGYNSQYASDAETYYFEAKSAYNEFSSKVTSTDENSLTTEVLIALVKKEAVIYTPLAKSAEAMFKGFDNSIENVYFDAGTISSGKSSMTWLKTSAESRYTSALEYINKTDDQDSKQDIIKKSEDIIKAKKDEIESLTLDIERQEKSLALLESGKTAKELDLDISLSKDETNLAGLELALQKLDIEQKWAKEAKEQEIKNTEIELKKLQRKREQIGKDEELTLAENNVKDAQIALDKTVKRLEAYQIIAPFAGKVNRVEFKVGDTVDTNSTSYIYIVNPNLIQITIQLDQVDIVKVQKWQEALITFDAYPEKTFTGSLGDVDGKPADSTTGDTSIVNYPVNIYFEKKEENIYSGMSANISIILGKKDDIITIPQTALETDPTTGEKYVSLDKNGVKTKQSVEVGITGNGSIEIISGINVGDKIYEVNFDANQFAPDQFYGGWMGF